MTHLIITRHLPVLIQFCAPAALLLCSANIEAAGLPGVHQTARPGDFPLVARGQSADILWDTNDFKVVSIAASLLGDDIELVSGVSPSRSNDGATAVIIGSLERSALIQEISAGRLDHDKLRGQWESFHMDVVTDPLPQSHPEIKRALVIAGSDRRGTAYAVFELSKAIGVSPWYWWADVPPLKRTDLFISPEPVRQGPPSVRYRGIFLNDEDWGLKPWAANTFEPETGDIGPKTYARIFELLLRLKANYCWPAMHACTQPFNSIPGNARTADDYAIVMGSSHAEPMLRNNVGEWKPFTREHRLPTDWSWLNNSNSMMAYWTARLETNGLFENLYTVGLRGIHDGAMPDGGTLDDKRPRLENVITTQRNLLATQLNPDVSRIPQAFVPYKEVQAIYDTGLELPSDVTLVWADDNHGYIRRLSNREERQRHGGAGVYYHLSYYGRPADYLWLYSTPPALIWAEMFKAYQLGASNIWVANVGDIKPGEIGMDYFLTLAWDIHRYGREGQKPFLRDFAARQFGITHADAIADVLDEYFHLGYERKPEHMHWKDAGPRARRNAPLFSFIHHGDAAGKRLGRYQRLEARASAIEQQLLPNQRDAYFELVLYPVRCAALQNEKFIEAGRSILAEEQGRGNPGIHATRAEAAHRRIQTETARYNERITGGKWNHMMNARPGINFSTLKVDGTPVFDMPQVATGQSNTPPNLGVVAEGHLGADANDRDHLPLVEKDGGTNGLPGFNGITRASHFLDLFNRGGGQLHWVAAADHPWVKLSKSSGLLDDEDRIGVTIDWDKAPDGETNSSIRIKSGEQAVSIPLQLWNPGTDVPGDVDFVEDNGVVAMEAEHASGFHAGQEASWQLITGLGRGEGAVAPMPFTANGISPEAIKRDAPAMEFAVWLRSSGEFTARVHCIPAHAIDAMHGRRYAIALDDESPQVVDLGRMKDERDSAWGRSVMRSEIVGESRHHVEQPGRHRLRLWMVDPAVTIDRVVLDFGGEHPTLGGPPETCRARTQGGG